MIYKNYFPKDTSREDTLQTMKNDGFEPKLITDKPGFIYELHTHPETKYLACLEGSMEVTVNGEKSGFEPGDKLIIDSNTPHSAVVGKNGCVFFWSEKII